MDLTELKKIDESSQEGVWVEWEDSRFKIRSTTSKAYRKALMKAAKGKSNHRLQRNVDAAEKFGIEIMAYGLLIDWENITDNGEPLPCTLENRLRVLTIAGPIRDFLSTAAQDHTTFEQEEEAGDAETFPDKRPVADEVGKDAKPSARKG